jgi:transposase InsO family protein
VGTLCYLFGKNRQWYYNRRGVMYTEFQRRKILRDLVLYFRFDDSRMGGVKLYTEIKLLVGKDLIRGRDSFLKFLRDNRLMLPRNKPRYTTDSRHPFMKYPNIVKGLEAKYPNHIWYADITYIWIEGDVLYLHLVTDGYSHAVLGWCLSETLEAVNTTAALEMAISMAGGGNLCGTIHHSDRGVQYACRMYVTKLMEHHIRISMTEDYKPTDNAVAERMNGILKTEWIYHTKQFRSRDEADFEIRRMIDFYNKKRPHMSIGMKKPLDVYYGEVPGPNLWHKKKLNGNKDNDDV